MNWFRKLPDEVKFLLTVLLTINALIGTAVFWIWVADQIFK